MAALVTKEDIEGVLLRPLSDTENTYFERLLQQVTETLETLLDVKMQGKANTPRRYETTCDSRFLVVDPFTSLLPEVTAESGKPLVVKCVSQFDELNASWFNIIEMAEPLEAGRYAVKAAWGYGEPLPYGLKILIARLFDTLSIANQGSFYNNVKSETVLSHSVTYDNTKQVIDQFAEANVDLLAKFVKPISSCVVSGYTDTPLSQRGVHRYDIPR
ncbi:MAG: hypothetical protein D8G53_11405 [Candidatus Saccharimonas sp.]|nr:MAG: hypothetical protein D8G53_11405 [Candidatus Saccharimonas sp.]